MKNNEFDINLLKVNCEYHAETVCCSNNGTFCGGCLATDFNNDYSSNWDFIPGWMNMNAVPKWFEILGFTEKK